MSLAKRMLTDVYGRKKSGIGSGAGRKTVAETIENTSRFVSDTLESTAIRIREAQQKTADEYELFDTHELEKSLKGHFGIEDRQTGKMLIMNYLKYARFLDMNDDRRIKREGYHLYNRIIFGNLYNYTNPVLRSMITQEVMEQMDADLKKMADVEFLKKK